MDQHQQAFHVFLERSVARVRMELPHRGVDEAFILGRCRARWSRMSMKERRGFFVNKGLESDQQDDRSQVIGQSSDEMQDVDHGRKVLPSYRELTAEELYGHSMVWDLQDDAPEDTKQPTIPCIQYDSQRRPFTSLAKILLVAFSFR